MFKKIGKESNDHWIVFNNSENLTFSDNISIDTFTKNSRLKEDNVKFSASKSQYYNSNYTQQIFDMVDGTDKLLATDQQIITRTWFLQQINIQITQEQ